MKKEISKFIILGTMYATLINLYPIGITRIESFNRQKKIKVGLFVNKQQGHKYY